MLKDESIINKRILEDLCKKHGVPVELIEQLLHIVSDQPSNLHEELIKRVIVEFADKFPGESER